MSDNYDGPQMAHKITRQQTEIDRLRGLLREWRQAADIAQDLTFVPIARKTDAALAGATDQPSAARCFKCGHEAHDGPCVNVTPDNGTPKP